MKGSRFLKKGLIAAALGLAITGNANASCGTSSLPGIPPEFAATITGALAATTSALAVAENQAGSSMSNSIKSGASSLSKQMKENTKTIIESLNKLYNQRAKNETADVISKNFGTPDPVKTLICENAKDAVKSQKALQNGSISYAGVNENIAKWISGGVKASKSMKDILETPEEKLQPEVLNNPDAKLEEKEMVIRTLVDPAPPTDVDEQTQTTMAGKAYTARNKIRKLRTKAAADVLTYIAALNTRDETSSLPKEDNPSVMEALSEVVGKNSFLNPDYQAHLEFPMGRDLDIEIIKQIAIGNQIQYYLNELKMREAVMEATYYGTRIVDNEKKDLDKVKSSLIGGVAKK